MATKKKPSALNSAKTRIQELETRLEEQKSSYQALNKELEVYKANNKALYNILDELKKEKAQFNEDLEGYEGLRTFLLDRLRDKRPEFVRSLFTNIKETINTDLACKIANSKEKLAGLEAQGNELNALINKAERYKL